MRLTSLASIGAILLAFGAAAVVVGILNALIRRFESRLQTLPPESRAAVHTRAVKLGRAITLLAYAIAAVATVSIGLERLGFSEPQWQPRQITHWLLTHGVNILIIVIGASVVLRAASLAVEHLQHRLGERHRRDDLEWQRRASTLSGILNSLVTVTVAFVAILMLLRELSIDVVPILTGAGIAGLAIGFGAQNLVRDVISGFFLILEDQVRIGDLARINGVGGVVEQINLRTIVLRDDDGAVQVFPNGTITALANLSKQFSYSTVDVRVSYSESLDRVIGTLREIGASMQSDPAWKLLVLAPIDVVGVQSIEDGGATIRTKFKTLPLSQGKVEHELRRRILATFVARGIQPYGGQRP